LNIKNRKSYLLKFQINGIGIEDVRKEDIFQRSYTKDKKVRGMGLGLSLVYKIIKSYKGKIWVENRFIQDYSKGSNFIV